MTQTTPTQRAHKRAGHMSGYGGDVGGDDVAGGGGRSNFEVRVGGSWPNAFEASARAGVPLLFFFLFFFLLLLLLPAAPPCNKGGGKNGVLVYPKCSCLASHRIMSLAMAKAWASSTFSQASTTLPSSTEGKKS